MLEIFFQAITVKFLCYLCLFFLGTSCFNSLRKHVYAFFLQALCVNLTSIRVRCSQCAIINKKYEIKNLYYVC